jgi:hypothetical protein
LAWFPHFTVCLFLFLSLFFFFFPTIKTEFSYTEMVHTLKLENLKLHLRSARHFFGFFVTF